LANVLGAMTNEQLPLPRLWYLPRGNKAAVVLTGDDHGGGGTTGRFDYLAAQSSPGCDVSSWQCLRATSYLYPNSSITDAQVAAYQNAGFEIALHPETGCSTPWTEASLRAVFDSQLPALVASRPSLVAPVTSRTHCIAWSDWATHPKVERDYGIRLDTNYYYYPPGWVQDRPGMFTGSGFPMRFADVDGSTIDVYQAATQMTDESGQSYPYTVNTLLDRALGAEGYYGTFTANIHTDSATPQLNADVVNSAVARGVPVISAQQLLTWLDGRNTSSFENLAFDGTDLTFTLTVGTGADGLEAMLPMDGGTGSLTTLTRDGSPVSLTQREVKGVTYAVFAGTPGAYSATYATDTTPPVISAVTAAPKSTSATITWSTDEPSTTAVSYGTDPNALSQTASTPGLSTSHSVTLTGLGDSTTYHYRVTSADARSNESTSPPAPGAPNQFTTSGPELEDTTTAHFDAGSGAGTIVTLVGDGAFTLGTSSTYSFDGASLPSGLSEGPAWSAGGASVVDGGAVAIDGTIVRADAPVGPGGSVEFEATFGAAAFQHVGLATDFDVQPWALFSTGSTTDTLYTRTKTAAGTIDIPLTPPSGSYIGSPHRYRIEWEAGSVRFFVDDELVQTHAATIATPMQAVASDFAVGGPTVAVDEMAVRTRETSGTFTSRVHDAGAIAAWSNLSTAGSLPDGTSQLFETRSGNSSTPDGTWSPWSAAGPAGKVNSPYGRYIQYRATLSTADPAAAPIVESVVLAYSRTGTVTAPLVSVPAIDPHRFTILVDGVPMAPSLAPGETTGPVTVPVGAHTMSLAAAGDTNLASYGVLFLGACSLTGTFTLVAGGSVVCTPVVIHQSIQAPDLSVSDPQIVRPTSGSAQAVFTVTRSGVAFFPISVNYATQDGTAKASLGDYTARSGTLVFDPSGPVSQTVSVPIAPTARHSVSDTFNLVLSAPSAARLADNVGTAQLINPNGPLSISVSDVDHVRSTTLATTARFTVRLSGAPAAGEQVTVQASTANGTGVAGTDYTALPATTLTFAPGEQTKSVDVTVAKKARSYAAKTFNLVLQNPSASAVLGDPTGVARLRSPGSAAALPTLSVSDVAVLRPPFLTKSATFTVTLSAPSTSTVTVAYATADGTATVANGDYVAASGTLTFNPGQVSKTVPVTFRASPRRGLHHTFDLVLSSPTGATLADTAGTARLIGLHGQFGLAATEVAVVRSASVGSLVPIVVRLNPLPYAGETAVTVNVATANGTAIAGTDYTALPTTPLTFAPGETSKTVYVPVLARPAGTPVRTFNLVLSSPSANAVITDTSTAVTLIGP
jgi:hypothetical protein